MERSEPLSVPTNVPDSRPRAQETRRFLSRKGTLPLYHQIREVLEGHIRSGALKPGAQLPSEEDLRQQFHVTRTTVRQAISSLVSEGLVYRRHGKGTFVGDPKIARRFARLTGFSEDVVAKGHRPGARILALRVMVPPADVARALRLPPDTLAVLVHRLRLLDGRPAAVQWSFLVAETVPGLEAADEFSSLYAELEARYGLLLHHADQVIETRQATAGETRLLRIASRAPVAQVTRTTYLDDGRPIEFARMVYRADLFRFEMQLWRTET